MTSIAMQRASGEWNGMRRRGQLPFGFTYGTLILFLALVLANTHFVSGNFSASLIFLPDAVQAGEWWRLVTFPLVHVTWYHLLLDGGAFFMLYHELGHERLAVRILYLLMCGAFSLGMALLLSPAIDFKGLCGLSGLAHGLMAVTSLQMMRDGDQFRAGSIGFVAVAGKSVYEALSGNVLFEFLQLGLCGSPIAVCHLGGVLGGVVTFALLHYRHLGPAFFQFLPVGQNLPKTVVKVFRKRCQLTDGEWRDEKHAGAIK